MFRPHGLDGSNDFPRSRSEAQTIAHQSASVHPATEPATDILHLWKLRLLSFAGDVFSPQRKPEIFRCLWFLFVSWEVHQAHRAHIFCRPVRHTAGRKWCRATSSFGSVARSFTRETAWVWARTTPSLPAAPALLSSAEAPSPSDEPCRWWRRRWTSGLWRRCWLRSKREKPGRALPAASTCRCKAARRLNNFGVWTSKLLSSFSLLLSGVWRSRERGCTKLLAFSLRFLVLSSTPAFESEQTRHEVLVESACGWATLLLFRAGVRLHVRPYLVVSEAFGPSFHGANHVWWLNTHGYFVFCGQGNLCFETSVPPNRAPGTRTRPPQYSPRWITVPAKDGGL